MQFHSTILNDETGLGKRVQISSLIGAIGASFHAVAIIFCPDSVKQNEWYYHLGIFAPNATAKMVDSTTLADLALQQPPSHLGMVYITTHDAIKRENARAIDALKCDLLVLDEAREFLSTEQINDLEQLNIQRKIVSASGNIMVRSIFFEL